MALPTTANVRRPRALGYSFRIDDLYLRGSVAPDRPLDITTAPLEAQKVNTATSAEDIRNEFGAIFSRASFVGGEGLDRAHEPDAAANRFWDSDHIDVSNPSPGQPAKITLLPVTGNIETSASSNLHLAWDGTRLTMAEGTNTRETQNPTATTPTFADSDPDAGEVSQTVVDLTTLGNITYGALGSIGLHKRDAGTWSSVNNTDTKKCWGVKGRLLVSTGSVLAEVDLADGTYDTLVALPAGQEWLDVEDAGKAILATATDGTVYALTSVAGVLTLQNQTPMRAGQVPYCVGFDGTFVFIGTREATPSGAIGRMYRAELADTYELANAQLLRQWGDQTATIDHSPRRIVAARDGVVWGIYETGGAALWRYDSASAGVVRYLDLVASGLVLDIVSANGRLFATVDGQGLRRENVGTYEASGYLMGPLGDLFSASAKSWAGALLDHEEIQSTCRIELYYTTDPAALSDPDSTSWKLVKRVETGIDDDETPLRGVDARSLAGMVKLYANTAADTAPAVRSFAFRAYPGPGDVELSLAINTSDVHTRFGFRPLHTRGQGALVYAALKGKEGRYAELEVLATGEIFRGVVKQVRTPIPSEAPRGSASVVTLLTFRGRRVDNTDLPDGLFGTGPWGSFTFGGLAA